MIFSSVKWQRKNGVFLYRQSCQCFRPRRCRIHQPTQTPNLRRWCCDCRDRSVCAHRIHMQAESREQVRSGQAIPGQARPSHEGDEGSSSIYYCYATCSHHDTIPADTVEHTVRDQGVLRACKKTHPFFSAFPLPTWVCLSRACLGKSIVLSIYKMVPQRPLCCRAF